MNRLRWGMVLSFTAVAGLLSAAAPAPLVSGDRLVVGGAGRGPLSAGLTSFPLGSANVFGSTRPDLFVVAGRFAHTPGLFLYRWIADDASGAPVFGSRTQVAYPADAKVPPPGLIFQTAKAIYGYWIVADKLVRARFDPAHLSFVRVPGPDIALQRPPGSVVRIDADGRAVDRLAVFQNPGGSLDLVFSVSDSTAYYPQESISRRDAAYHSFDGRGIWRGGLPYVFLCLARLPGAEAAASGSLELKPASSSRRDALLSQGNLAAVDLGPGEERDLVTGSHFSDLYFYRCGTTGLSDRGYVRSPDGAVQRHPTIWTSPIAFAGANGRASDLIAGGEGALYYYRFAGFDAERRPTWRRPVAVLEQNAALYAGSLPAVNAVDWDGDGATDLVAGNSEGRILFFRNQGTDARPDFSPGLPLAAGGEEIHIQQGYSALQGPDEAAWGYVAPVVADWNGDGLLDILMSDATARPTVFMNRGSRTAPRLGSGETLYCDGLPVHGTWRSRPAVGHLGQRTAYVALDDDDQLRIYWRVDDFTVSDGGKLRLMDGSPIQANFLPGGATGRARLTLFDWDGDGRTDLLIGTPRHGSVPNPRNGLPQSLGLPGSAVLWLRNVGSNDTPVFSFPVLLRVKGRPVYFGQHECSLAVTSLGGGGPNLIVGDEEGRITFFRRPDISWGK